MSGPRRPKALDNGVLAYPHVGWEPPPPIDGYRRKADQGPDAWVFVPEWHDCPHRQVELRLRENCNCMYPFHSCDLDGQQTSVVKCSTCGGKP